MEEITVLDMAQALKISSGAVKMRLSRKGVQPFKYIGSAGLYRKSDIELIREAPRGRPRLKAAPETPPKPRQAKAKPKTTKPQKS
jgi:hypothetical protein